jgi:hypothetical protein
MIQNVYLFIQQHKNDPVFIVLVLVVLVPLILFSIRLEKQKLTRLFQAWGRTNGLTFCSFKSYGGKINGKALDNEYWEKWEVLFLDKTSQKCIIYMGVSKIPFVRDAIKEVQWGNGR